MKTWAFTLCLKDDPELIAEYRRHHQEAWPEVLAGLHDVGIRDMKIWLLGTRLFMYVEADDGFDPDRDFPRANSSPRAQEWDSLMRSLQQRAPEAPADAWWAQMELVFSKRWPNHQV